MSGIKFNNRNRLFLFLALTHLIMMHAQIVFTAHEVSNSVNGSVSVYPADIDGDGDLDIISAARIGDAIYWHENFDGLGNFTAKHLILNINDPIAIFVSDIDADGDMDVLAASLQNNQVLWIENLDGIGNFALKQILTSNAQGPTDVSTGDFDGDGDLDILSAYLFDNSVVWFENLDGQGNFSAENVINTTLNDGISIAYSADLDNDGDTDVFVPAIGSLAWYENTDGLGDFSTEHIIYSSTAIPNIRWTTMLAFDIDADGDLDVLATGTMNTSSGEKSKLVLHKNINGQGDFGSQQIIVENLSYYLADPTFADIDSDNTDEIITAAEHGGFDYFKNIGGTGTQFESYTIASNLNLPYVTMKGDINTDGLIDLISNSYFDDRVVWFENTGVALSTQEFSLNTTVIYPNPSSNQIFIQSNYSIKESIIFDIHGRLVKKYSGNEIDISDLNEGLYFLKIKNLNGKFITKKLIKN